MLKRSLLLLTLLTSQGMASEFDLKATMQHMKLEFIHAAEAQTVEEMRESMTTFNALLQASHQANYPDEKRSHYLEGFEKIGGIVESVDRQLEQGNLEEAKKQLKSIDELRMEYHDKRNPSIWSKLFG